MDSVDPQSAFVRHRVLWDGECALCGRAARWCQRKDVRGRLEVIAYQKAPSPPMTDALRVACAGALHVVRGDGEVLRAGRALLFAFGELGYPRTARLFARRPLIWAVEMVYYAVARNRRRLSRLLFRGEVAERSAPAAREENGP
jgi:predicted DCC family thiol-disulfide oxidoreductase YuxK